jgi:hypothetical protein
MNTILGKPNSMWFWHLGIYMLDVFCDTTDGTFVVGLFSSEFRGNWEGVAAKQPHETFNIGVCKGV